VGGIEAREARKPLDFFNAGYLGSLATMHANLAEKAQPPFRQPSHARPRENLQPAQIGESVDFVAHVVPQLGRHILGEVLGLCGSARNSSPRRECS
jgi:Flp pilus assembly CpaF family ATPase